MLLFCERLPSLESEISNLKSEIPNLKSGIPNLKSGISNFKSEISDMKSLAESCSRQIRAWADQLQNSDIQGPRRLTEKSRHAWQADRRAEAFLQKLQDIRDAAADPPPIRDAARRPNNSREQP